MSSYDPIDEALNTTSAIEVSTTPENGCITRKDSTKNITDDVERFIKKKIPFKKIYNENEMVSILNNINFNQKLINFFQNNLNFKKCYRYNYSENTGNLEDSELISVIIGKDVENQIEKIYLVYQLNLGRMTVPP